MRGGGTGGRLCEDRRMAKLHFRYAAMNAGKSTALLQAAHNYEEHGMAVRLFTAALDDRAGKGVIASRLGIARDAETFGPATEFVRSHFDDGIACWSLEPAALASPWRGYF